MKLKIFFRITCLYLYIYFMNFVCLYVCLHFPQLPSHISMTCFRFFFLNVQDNAAIFGRNCFSDHQNIFTPQSWDANIATSGREFIPPQTSTVNDVIYSRTSGCAKINIPFCLLFDNQMAKESKIMNGY